MHQRLDPSHAPWTGTPAVHPRISQDANWPTAVILDLTHATHLDVIAAAHTNLQSAMHLDLAPDICSGRYVSRTPANLPSFVCALALIGRLLCSCV
jgi:hypothetical protein